MGLRRSSSAQHRAASLIKTGECLSFVNEGAEAECWPELSSSSWHMRLFYEGIALHIDIPTNPLNAHWNFAIFLKFALFTEQPVEANRG